MNTFAEDMMTFIGLIEQTMAGTEYAKMDKDQITFEYVAMIILLDTQYPDILNRLERALPTILLAREAKHGTANRPNPVS